MRMWIALAISSSVRQSSDPRKFQGKFIIVQYCSRRGKVPLWLEFSRHLPTLAVKGMGESTVGRCEELVNDSKIEREGKNERNKAGKQEGGTMSLIRHLLTSCRQ